MNTELVEYVKNKSGNLVGVVVALKIPTNPSFVGLGWSKCRKNDLFSKDFGLKIARNRAATGSRAVIPRTIQQTHRKMKDRAGRYFKDCSVVDSWA